MDRRNHLSISPAGPSYASSGASALVATDSPAAQHQQGNNLQKGRCTNPVIPPRVTAITKGVAATQRDHIARIAKHRRMGWQRRSHRNRRCLIETASCRARHRQVYAERRIMPSAISRSQIPVGPVGVRFGIVLRLGDRPLGNSVKRPHGAASCLPSTLQRLDRRRHQSALLVETENYAEWIAIEMCIPAGSASTWAYQVTAIRHSSTLGIDRNASLQDYHRPAPPLRTTR
jgi:hypothetical protein